MGILIINGSPRLDNKTYLVCERVEKICKKKNIDCELMNLYELENNFEQYQNHVFRHNMILWCIPEYNRSFTSVVKLFVEKLGVECLSKKLSGIIATSIGPSARAGLNQSANLLFSMDSVVVTPGIVYYFLTKDTDKINKNISILIDNMNYFEKKLF